MYCFSTAGSGTTGGAHHAEEGAPMTDHSAICGTVRGPAADTVAAARRRQVPLLRMTHLAWRPVDGECVAVVARARNWLGRSLPRLVGRGPCGSLLDDAEL